VGDGLGDLLCQGFIALHRRVQLICTSSELIATVLSQDSTWQIPHDVHLIRCFFGKSESVISATVLAQ
jgi:hypothetical protein